MDNEKKLAFVTGSTGLVGINLIQELVKDNWDIVAMHRKNSDTKELEKLGVKLVQGDVTDRESIEKAIPEGATVFHSAALVTYWRNRDKEQQITNVDGVKNMVEVALSKHVKKFVHTSTLLTFDSGNGTRITEQTPKVNTDHWVGYIRTKRLGEIEVEKAMANGLDAVILNPGPIVGAYDKHSWSNLLTAIYRREKMVGAPGGTVSWCHARPVAKAHIEAAKRGRTGHYYLLGGTDASFLEAVQYICKILDRPVIKKAQPTWLLKIVAQFLQLGSYVTGKEPLMTPELADVAPRTVICSSEKAIKELDYQPSSIEEMFDDCHQWMVSNNMLEQASKGRQ